MKPPKMLLKPAPEKKQKKKQTNKQKKKNCSASRLIDNSLLAHGVFCARCTSPTLL